MPISDKLGKPFGLLSLICKNKKDDDRLQQPHHRSNHVGHASASSTPMSASASSSSVRGAFNPNPTGGHYGVKGGAARPSYYAGSSVQYERLTPAAPSHESQNHPSPAQVQYEPLRPSSRPPPVPTSAALNTAYAPVRLPSPQVQYERLSSSAAPAQPSSLMPPHRLNSPSQFEPTLPAPIRANSPVAYEPVNVRQHSPVVYDRLSPSINATTGMLSSSSQPVPPLAAALKQDPRSLHSPAVAGGQRPYETSMDTPTIKSERGTPGYSDKSTPFSVVMEEWMSQLRTPTPDVTLLPSPYDFNSDMPTPMERVDGFKQLQEALLPTPPPDVHDQTQSTKSNEYVLSSAARRPLVEDIASLCRDLISQEITDSRSKGKLPSPNVMGESPSMRKIGHPTEDNDDDDDDTTSADGNDKNTSGSSSKGKRRKMCNVEGCGNLSRSRGLCKAHGGGRRCSVEGCTRASQSGSLCITHGGGKRCTVEGCVKAAQSRGMCKAHGGGVRCRVEGCTKSSQGDGFCRTHGGGRRCGHPDGCTKWAQRNGMCMAHSEGKYGNSYRGRLHRMEHQKLLAAAENPRAAVS